MLVRAVAEFWNPDIVDWGRRGRGNQGALHGEAAPVGAAAFGVDLWNAAGVYVLYSDFRPVYVGQAVDKRVGPRLREHLADRLAGRWDMFSIFCVSTLNSTTGTTRAPGGRHVSAQDTIDTVEAVLIQALHPPLNRRYNEIPRATRVRQADAAARRSMRGYLEEILDVVNDLEEFQRGPSDS